MSTHNKELSSELVTVVIPVYNVEKYLQDCLDSVLRQSYTNLEVILVNDGSTDGSGDICDKYAERDERIKVIHKENAGQAVARNVAIRQARGTFISFIDSDDWIEPNMYERAIHEFRADPKLSLIRFGLRVCYSSPDGVTSSVDDTYKYFALVLQGEEILSTYSEEEGMDGIMCSSVFRTELFTGKGSQDEASEALYYPEGIVHEDEILSLCLALKLSQSSLGEKAMIVRDIMYNYRKSIVSTMSHIKPKHMLDLCFGLGLVRSYGLKLQAHQGLLDYKILQSLCNHYGQWVGAGISLSDINQSSQQLRKDIDCRYLSIKRGRWLYRLFCLSPRLFHYVERIYAPIVRRLGISTRYK